MTKNNARREKFKKLGQMVSAFNPHYSIKPTAVRDRQLSLIVGPKLKTQQWERTSGGRG